MDGRVDRGERVEPGAVEARIEAVTRALFRVASRLQIDPWLMCESWTYPRLWLFVRYLRASDADDMEAHRKMAAEHGKRDEPGAFTKTVSLDSAIEKLAMSGIPGCKVIG